MYVASNGLVITYIAYIIQQTCHDKKQGSKSSWEGNERWSQPFFKVDSEGAVTWIPTT